MMNPTDEVFATSERKVEHATTEIPEVKAESGDRSAFASLDESVVDVALNSVLPIVPFLVVDVGQSEVYVPLIN